MQNFAAAYCAAAPAAAPFLLPQFAQREHRQRICEHRRQAIPLALQNEFARQNPGSKARQEALGQLADPNTLIVATGQQVGPFLGPLYTLYKAAAAVRIAQQLAEETGRPVVPIFWLQTEDHDADEIGRCILPVSDKAANPKSLPMQPHGSTRASVEHLSYGEEISTVIESLRRILGPTAQEKLALLCRHYKPGQSPASAFAGLLLELFTTTPLLVLNPRRETVARLALPWHRQAIEQHTEIWQALHRRAGALHKAQYAVQITPRADCCLSFYHPDGFEQARFRLRPTEQGCELAGHHARLAYSSLWDTCEQEPRCMSSSALLRPLIQDALLPTVAYVAGPGEINYFAQLAPLYERWSIPMPMIVPRPHVTWLSPKDRQDLETLHLQSDDLKRPPHILRLIVAQRSAARGEGPHAQALSRLLAEQRQLVESVESTLRGWRDDLETIDPKLLRAQEKTMRSIHRNLNKFTNRIEGAGQTADTDSQKCLQRLLCRLRPFAQPQERVHGLPLLLLESTSPQQRITALLARYRPFSTEPIEMDL
ncbi:MAG: bacillithiol biosynthesis cysteine-adding enzyme BshC [Myxococcota bacterium]